MTVLKLGRYLKCIECGTYTAISPDEDSMTRPCGQCDSEGSDDPYCTTTVEITDCPRIPDPCDSDDHHYGLDGQHETDIAL